VATPFSTKLPGWDLHTCVYRRYLKATRHCAAHGDIVVFHSRHGKDSPFHCRWPCVTHRWHWLRFVQSRRPCYSVKPFWNFAHHGIKHSDFCCFKGVTYFTLTLWFKLRSMFTLICCKTYEALYLSESLGRKDCGTKTDVGLLTYWRLKLLYYVYIYVFPGALSVVFCRFTVFFPVLLFMSCAVWLTNETVKSFKQRDAVTWYNQQFIALIFSLTRRELWHIRQTADDEYMRCTIKLPSQDFWSDRRRNPWWQVQTGPDGECWHSWWQPPLFSAQLSNGFSPGIAHTDHHLQWTWK